MVRIPPLRGQGRILWPFDKIKDEDLSPCQLFDQMTRHLSNHKHNGDEEGDSYMKRLEKVLQSKALHLQDLLKQVNPNIKEDDLKLKFEETTDGNIYELIRNLTTTLKSRKQETETDLLRESILTYIVYLELNIEHHTISINIKTKEGITTLPAEDAEIEEIPELSEKTSTPLPEFSGFRRRYPRVSSQESTVKMKTSTHHSRQVTKQLEELESEKEDLQNNILTLKSKLREHITKINELETTNKELEDKVQRLETNMNEAKDNLLLELRENEKLRKELEFSQQQFANINMQIAQENKSQNIDHEDETVYHLEDELLSSEQDASTEPDVPERLQTQDLKTLLNKIKEYENNSLKSEEEEKAYHNGLNMLKKDFLNFGRKEWSTKTVSSMLKRLTRANPSSSGNLKDLGLDVTSELIPVLKKVAETKGTVNNLYEKSSEEIENLRQQKLKYTHLQNLIATDITTLDQQLDAIQNGLIQTLDGIKRENIFTYSKLEESIKHIIKENLKMNKPDKTLTETTSKVPIAPTQNLQRDGQNTKKIVIIPKSREDFPQLQKTITNNMKEKELRPLFNSLKITKNKNIQIQTNEENFKKLESRLQQDEEQKFQIIDPDTRRRKLILLRVPLDLTKEDIESEITYKRIFKNDDFNLEKSLLTKDKQRRNWIIETNIKNYREILRNGFITLYLERLKVDNFIRVMRCTNCQALNDHSKNNCKFRTVCGTCAGAHTTSQCPRSNVSCINCHRVQEVPKDHEAYSPQCPQYQKERDWLMDQHYNRNTHEETDTRNLPPPQTNKASSNIPRRKILKPKRDEYPQSSRAYDSSSEGEDELERYTSNKPKRRPRNFEERTYARASSTNYKETALRRGRSQYRTIVTTEDDDAAQDKNKADRERSGEVRIVRNRTFENTNRRRQTYQYPRYTWEALPPRFR